jgi:peptide/nickel transport system substrate-binding protein
VDGRRNRRQEELRSYVPASAGNRSPLKRCTATRLQCGVFFCLTIVLVTCAKPRNPSETQADVLTIGFPEGGASGTELGVGQMTASLSLEGLTQVGADGRAVARLAESWRWENDGKTLRIHLRSDVVFHDGTRLDERIAAVALQQAVARPANRALYSSLSDIAGIKSAAPFSVDIDLTQHSAFLPEDLDLPLGIGDGGIGTGPFRILSRTPTEIVLGRFDQYYLGTPTIRRLVVRPVGTLRTAWTSLLRGDVDMVTDVPHDVAEFVSNDDVEVIPYERRYQFVIAFNSRKRPFSSALVRRALNTAINREDLITRVLRGRGTPATGPVWPKYWAYDRTVPSYAYDPALVNSLLDGAGYRLNSTTSRSAPPARFRFNCILPANFAILERIGLEVQRQLYNVGVDMQFDVLPVEEYNARIQSGRFDAVLIDLISGPTPNRSYIFWRSAKRFKGLNVFGYENAEVEALFDTLRTSTNDAATRSATRGLERAFVDDPPALFLVWNERARAVRRNFKIPRDVGRDPIQTLWKWAPSDALQTAAR